LYYKKVLQKGTNLAAFSKTMDDGQTKMSQSVPPTVGPCHSTKQKLNTRSSTESELVGVDDCMPAILWTRYFLKAQSYNVNKMIVFQDNQSAILLAKNGKSSSSKRQTYQNLLLFRN
jgi:hypothetical protein